MSRTAILGLPLALLLTSAHAVTHSTSSRRLLDDITCPPPGFDAVSDFDINAYIDGPWYVQAQMPLVYQPEDQLYCVRASYTPIDESDLSVGLKVTNTANEGGVDGEPVGTRDDNSFFPLVAVPSDENPAKLKVGPDLGFVPGVQQVSMGDYWVVWANGSSSSGYDLAIISGGAPTRETDDGCATGSSISFFRRFQFNDIGMWLFSRMPVDVKGTEVMLEAATDLGLDVSELVNVRQKGCTYPPIED